MRYDGAMRTISKLKALVLLLAAAAAGPAFAQDAAEPPSANAAGEMVAWSAAVQAATVCEAFLYEKDWFPWLLQGTATLQHLPAILYEADGAWTNAGVQLGLDALFAGDQLLFGQNLTTPLAANTAHKYSMWATYDAYADLRTRADDPDYAEGIRRESFGDMALATFQPARYANWETLGYLGIITAMSVIPMFTEEGSEAVWTTGEAWLGGMEFSPWIGVPLILLLQVPNFVMTGIGEEALYRGTYYEELSYRLGRWPASIIDALYFTASHVPQQWNQLGSMSAFEIILPNLLAIAQTYWLQQIYDRHGLGTAVAAHAMSDIIAMFCDWLLYGGVPNEHGFSINERGGLLSIGVKFEY